MNITLEYPSLRGYLIDALDDLKDKDMQLKEWVDPNYHHAFWDSALSSFECVEDLNLLNILIGTQPRNFQEGVTLFNAEETKAMMRVTLAIERACEEVGVKQPDTAYITSPFWEDVISSSKQAYDLLVKNNEKYGFSLEEIENGSSEQSLQNEAAVI